MGLLRNATNPRLDQELATLSDRVRDYLVETDLTDKRVDLIPQLIQHVAPLLRASYENLKEAEALALTERLVKVLGEEDPTLLEEMPGPLLVRALKDPATRIDLVVSSLKWSWVRLLETDLKRATARGVPVRVLTTVYMGATDPVARVNGLGAEVRVSYNKPGGRLHVKAWVFHRPRGLGTAYVGSSNLSQAAVTDGLEWNVKVSERETPKVFRAAAVGLETLWNDREFEAYDPGQADRLAAGPGRDRHHASAESSLRTSGPGHGPALVQDWALKGNGHFILATFGNLMKSLMAAIPILTQNAIVTTVSRTPKPSKKRNPHDPSECQIHPL